LIAATEGAAQVGGSPGQDEGDEDALAVLAAHDVEAEARRALLHQNLTRLPVNYSNYVATNKRIAQREKTNMVRATQNDGEAMFKAYRGIMKELIKPKIKG
jgi:hypothetical protein